MRLFQNLEKWYSDVPVMRKDSKNLTLWGNDVTQISIELWVTQWLTCNDAIMLYIISVISLMWALVQKFYTNWISYEPMRIRIREQVSSYSDVNPWLLSFLFIIFCKLLFPFTVQPRNGKCQLQSIHNYTSISIYLSIWASGCFAI